MMICSIDNRFEIRKMEVVECLLLITLRNAVVFFPSLLALQLPTCLNYLPRPTNGSDVILTLACNCETL
jgi:hypothetical protein